MSEHILSNCTSLGNPQSRSRPCQLRYPSCFFHGIRRKQRLNDALLSLVVRTSDMKYSAFKGDDGIEGKLYQTRRE